MSTKVNFSCTCAFFFVPLQAETYKYTTKLYTNMLLNIETPAPKILPADSIKHITENFIQQVQSEPEVVLRGWLDSAIDFGIKVLIALVLYFVGAWVIRRIKRMLERIFERRKTERTLASFVTSFTSIALTVILILVLIGTLGLDTTSFAALLTAGGMAIGMALSGTVQNFAGGIMLLVFRPFKAGDFINAQGVSGTVMEVTIVTTRILTVDNRVIILPNGALFNGTIENVSAQVLRRVDWTVSVDYGVDADGCIALLKELILSDERILTSQHERPKNASPVAIDTTKITIPDPFVALSSLNDNNISFVVRAWVKSADYWDVYFHFNKLFYTELPKHGYTFAYPHMDVTLTTNNEER